MQTTIHTHCPNCDSALNELEKEVQLCFWCDWCQAEEEPNPVDPRATIESTTTKVILKFPDPIL
jgi:hypothetical protein